MTTKGASMRRWIMLIALVAVIAVAGCGGSDEGAQPSAAGAPTSSSPVRAEAISLQREGRELVAKVHVVEAAGARARRKMWRAGEVGCYSCAAFYRERLHEATAQIGRLGERVDSVTRRAQGLLEGIDAER